MIKCPNCHHEELPGALYCTECGTQLVVSQTTTTQHIQRNPSDVLVVSPPSQTPSKPGGYSESEAEYTVFLSFVDSGKVIELSGQNEYTLGRSSEGQPILPDIDLSPYDAYSKGVSRLHAALKIQSHRVVITDLGSSNGTRVNGQKIVPHVDYPLNHGDMISLGKFSLQILIKK